MKKKNLAALLRRAFVNSIPVLTGYVVLGIGFGILSEKNGYGVWWALAMSVFIYAGSMQFVTVSLLTSGASLISAALATLMVNARHLFYGISMITKYKDTGKKKPYLIFALTDETYSLVVNDELPAGEEKNLYYLLVSFFDQCYWVTGSVLGAVIGSVLPFDSTGIDFAMTALFVTVFVEQWLSTKNHVPAIVGVLATLGCLIFFGAEQFLIPSMLLITAILTICRKWLEPKEDEQNA